MIALLPMKANSERVPNKNIKHLKGSPLFYYVADVLQESQLFRKLVINTDSEKISHLASERYGDWIHIIKRPLNLCGDHVPMNKIIRYDLSVLSYDETFFQTHSTNPFLSCSTVKDAIIQYEKGKIEKQIDSVFSVNSLHTRLYDKKLTPINHNPSDLIRTQDLDVIYEENSNFYIFSRESFFSTNHRIGENPAPYVMNRNSIEVVDIDEPEDWRFAETIINSGYYYEK